MPSKSRSSTRFSNKVTKLLNENIQNIINSKDLASFLNISTRSLSRNLEKEGTHFKELQSIVRTKKSCGLLEETDLSVEMIAIQVGYRSRRSLDRSFQYRLNTTPSEYRKNFNSQGKPKSTAGIFPL